MNRSARAGAISRSHNVRLGGAVKEEKRRAIPTNDSVNRGAKAVDRIGSESRKEGCCLAPNRIQLTSENLRLREHMVSLTHG